ncbi:MAG TPA: VCBS repeat-containing protein [Gemmatimonadales bacterium]|nr:VCBS repeat-containing protein [Gemmatimonadales bacterium]
MRYAGAVGLAAAAALSACGRPSAPPLFELLSPAATGVGFTNALPESADFNIINYLYYYDGGGVAVGDVNNDGLPDLYFTANLGSNHLYLNKGNYRFEDVTARAGVADTAGWKTGVTMADVDGDGKVDIYVSGVDYLDQHGHNVLYVNNGDGTFTDRTREYGLDHVGHSTQALFFDYDGDGDLDMYLLTHSTHRNMVKYGRRPPDQASGDRLYRNDGGHFVDVTDAAGIQGGSEEYGLGVVASDVNLDGCPDLYIANDFEQNDHLYINTCNGTFTESIARATGHISKSSMGVDAADLNNDGRPDVMVLDMLPELQVIRNTSSSTENMVAFNLKVEAGFHPQYTRNTLQLNRGLGRFSEIGALSGVAATDWSWAPLLADLDNDGRKDLFVTNGIYRRPNDLDYVGFVGKDSIQASLSIAVTSENLAPLLQRMPHVPIANYAFHNNGDLTFTNEARAWGLAQPGFSNGAVYADLNNDGALDLVVNQLGAPAAIYRNRAREVNHNHSLRVVLRGSGGNSDGIGAKVLVTTRGTTQLVEQMPTRGFQSSVDPRLHFGVGDATRVDSVTVIWPDRRFQVLTGVAVDTTLTLQQANAAGRYAYPHGTAVAAPAPLFGDASDRIRGAVPHKENAFSDLTLQPLLPHYLSTEGPALAVGDVNGDGREDIYLGGAKWQPGQLLLQQPDGSFRPTPEPAFQADSLFEDIDAALFDADGDGHPDLYVVSGGNEFWGSDDALRGRLYHNDGRVHFQRVPDALPPFFEDGACVVPGDFNHDGHIDLFLGSRVISRQYGVPPHSHLLQNDGHGHFTDVTQQLAPGLSQIGMVTAASWIDYDHDGQLDLVVVGEWMAVRLFHQEQGRFVDRTAQAGLAGTEGWWNSVTAVDVNGDGRPDLVLGNLGLNSLLHASPSEPARLYVGDFAHNGLIEQILTSYGDGVSYPIAARDELLRLIPQLQSRYTTYASFGASRIEDIFSGADLKRARLLEAHTFASSVALNNGNGTFTLRPLPAEAQVAPIRAVVAEDFDGDGHMDLLVAGNLYGVPPVLGRYDASYGLLLKGTGDGRFSTVDMEQSGILIDGQVPHMVSIAVTGGRRGIVVARNNERLELLLRH